MADYDYTGTYTVSTGTDIYVVFGEKIMTTAQGVSYSITRQKAPVYVMGNSDPKAIARSKRGIAGSMIMTTFDRHCLADFISAREFYGKQDEIASTQANPYNAGFAAGVPSDEATLVDALNAANVLGSEVGNAAVNPAESLAAPTHPMYADQLLPFDVTLSAMNEYGNGQAMRIYALEILNEGSGVSIDDTSNEVQLTYIARMLSPWINQSIRASQPITNPS